jgi:hypothetical protein
MRTPKSLLYVVFRPELSSWGLDLSFSGLIWQGLFSSSNSRDSKDIYVIMAVRVSHESCTSISSLSFSGFLFFLFLRFWGMVFDFYLVASDD